ncbi:MAG: dcm methylase [Halomonadaceae bacterium]|nr:dcm methylase [Halomonadaceae bacterium]
MRDTILCLCDLTGTMAEPWVSAGYRAILIDPQHPEGVHQEGRVIRVGHVIDHPEAWRVVRENLHRLAFVAGFPPCTDLAVSGARWFPVKREADPAFQFKAMQVVWQCHVIGELSGAPWFAENPVSQIATYWRARDHFFHPWWFTALETSDNYTKQTCLWAGGGFAMPESCPRPEVQSAVDAVMSRYGRMVPIKRLRDDGAESWVLDHYPDNRIHFASPGVERANMRSATPRGFSMAVFEKHRPAASIKEAA